MRQEPFLALMQNFLERRIQAQAFCTEYMRQWAKERDAGYAKKADWPEPYDEQIIAAFQRGEISGAQFSERFAELWGYDPDAQNILDAVHSACDCFYPFPERDGEIDEDQLRREVAEAFAKLREPSQSLIQAL